MRKDAGEDYGVARGVDFKNVATVVNFDFPLSIKNYVHRIGRTARGGSHGTALSLLAGGDEETLLAELMNHQIEQSRRVTTNPKAAISPLEINLSDIEGFRYRVESVLKNVTRSAVKEARLKELRMEVMNSQKLKAHFEDNPRELAMLKHAKVLRPTKVQPALKSVPSYLLPATAKASVVNDVKAQRRKKKRRREGSAVFVRRKAGDPLKTFSFGASGRVRAALAEKSASGKRRDYRRNRSSNKRRKKKDRNKMAVLGMK
uniref:RNA helicase n=1 Tax=Bigelowiella natans TaxID=227086 RepID=A0A7S2KII7_BIGNA|mmetsp:Transcript_1340/g.2015  ORF Transcript_1340/g.2015 Transcript_1340/m.2015 type:complete len:260 (+) Transcript_1340:537-1316(+)